MPRKPVSLNCPPPAWAVRWSMVARLRSNSSSPLTFSIPVGTSVRKAEAFCKEHLGSENLAACVKREKYRCELLEQEGTPPEEQP